MADALVELRPSGLVTVTVRSPAIAEAETVTLMVMFVGFENVTLLIVTPPPFTAAAI